MRGRRNGVGIEGKEDSRNTREQASKHVSDRDDKTGVNAGKARGFFVMADGIKVAAIDGLVQHEPHDNGNDDEKHERHGEAQETAAGEALQGLETVRLAEAFRGVL